MRHPLLGAALATALMLGAASSASAGICMTTIGTFWFENTMRSTNNLASENSFQACSSTSRFWGQVAGGSGLDLFEFSVFATDDETIAFSATGTENINPDGVVQLPGFELTLVQIEWLNMTGDILDVIDNSAEIDVQSHTADTITFIMNDVSQFVGGDTSFTFDLGSFKIIPTHVPEPGTLAILGLGLAGLGLARRRKAAV